MNRLVFLFFLFTISLYHTQIIWFVSVVIIHLTHSHVAYPVIHLRGYLERCIDDKSYIPKAGMTVLRDGTENLWADGYPLLLG